MSWHFLACFPAWRSSSFSTLNLWCHLGLPRELKQILDVLNWNYSFKTNSILHKLSYVLKKKKKEKKKAVTTLHLPHFQIRMLESFYNWLRKCKFSHWKLDFKFYTQLEVSLSFMSCEFDSMSISLILANYSSLEILAYSKIVLCIVIPKRNQI